jgi:hypothetical protein
MLVCLYSQKAQIVGGDLIVRPFGCLLLGFQPRSTNSTAFLVRTGRYVGHAGTRVADRLWSLV